MDVGAVAVALAVGVAVVAAVPLGDVRWTLALLLIAAGIAFGAARASDADGLADALALVLAAGGGIVFARVFDEAALALAVGLLGTGLGLAGLAAGATAGGQIDPIGVAYLAAYVAWTRDLGVPRRRWALPLLAIAMAVAVGIGTAVDVVAPVVAALSVVFLVTCGDRLVVARDARRAGGARDGRAPAGSCSSPSPGGATARTSAPQGAPGLAGGPSYSVRTILPSLPPAAKRS